MKKIAIIFLSALLFALLTLSVCADVVTTVPRESTAETSTPAGYEDGLVYDVDITAPITACVIAVVGMTIYGIVKLKKAKKDDFNI